MFKIIGDAEAAANLLCEFKIAEKKDAKLIKNKNGKVIRVKFIAKSIFSSAPLNPGAIRKTKSGIKSSINKTIKNRIKTNKLNIFVANLSELYFPFFNSDAQLGTKAALKVPSENSLLKVFGILKATKNASAKMPVPRKIAIKISLI